MPVEVLARNEKVYVWCSARSVKGRNAALGGKAAVTAYKGPAGILVRGAIRLIPKGARGYDELAKAFLKKYQREETYGNDLMIEVKPERVSEWLV